MGRMELLVLSVATRSVVGVMEGLLSCGRNNIANAIKVKPVIIAIGTANELVFWVGSIFQ